MVDFGSRQRFFVFDIFGYSDIILPAALRAAGAMWDYNYFWRRSAPHCVPPARDDAPRYVPGHSAHPCRCGPVFLPGGSPGNGGTRLLPLTDFGACVMRCSPTTFRCMCLHTDRLTGCAWPPTTFRFAGPAPCPPALPIRARPTSAMFGVALSARQPHTVCPCRAMPCSHEYVRVADIVLGWCSPRCYCSRPRAPGHGSCTCLALQAGIAVALI